MEGWSEERRLRSKSLKTDRDVATRGIETGVNAVYTIQSNVKKTNDESVLYYSLALTLPGLGWGRSWARPGLFSRAYWVGRQKPSW